MRWDNKTKKRSPASECFYVKEIICAAYYEGFINWNVYQKAIDKVTANMRGGWMFEQKTMGNDKEKGK